MTEANSLQEKLEERRADEMTEGKPPEAKSEKFPKDMTEYNRQTMSKPTIVFVHGAWHSPKFMEPAQEILRSRGYESVCPSLPTMGHKDSHEFKSKNFYDDAALIGAVVSQLVDEGKEVLVASHSYGGQVASEAVHAEMGQKARASNGKQGGVVGLVFICAFFVPEGKIGIANLLMPRFPPPHFVSPHPFKRYLAVKNSASSFFNDLEPAEQQRWDAELQVASLTGLAKPTSYAAQRHFDTMYVHTALDRAIWPQLQHYMVEQNQAVGIHLTKAVELEAGHAPFLSVPDRLVDELIIFAEACCRKNVDLSGAGVAT